MANIARNHSKRFAISRPSTWPVIALVATIILTAAESHGAHAAYSAHRLRSPQRGGRASARARGSGLRAAKAGPATPPTSRPSSTIPGGSDRPPRR
jgi:hypothetical protein